MKAALGLVSGWLAACLVACSGGASADGGRSSPSGATSPEAGASPRALSSQWDILNTSYEDALAVPVQLAVGTIQLDGAEDAVTADQAADLLTLWQGYASLLAADAPAQEEYQGLQHQIEETMTAAQLQAIARAQLTTEDMATALSRLGSEMAARPPALRDRSSSGSGSSSSGGFGGAGGGPPSGGGPMGGGAEMMMVGGPPGGMASTETADAQADPSSAPAVPASGEISPQLVQAVIVYLRGELAPPASGD